MIKKILRTLPVILFLLSFVFAGSTSAQSLNFSVPAEVINVTITPQGTMAIDYRITFDNTHGGDVIDAVDIGLPNQNYVLSTITADVNGTPVTVDKGDPQYIAIGVTLTLGAQAIQPGQTGTVHLAVGEVDKVLFPYTYNNVKNYASFEFMPNTFGSSYVANAGSTHLTLSLHLPPGIQSNEPVYYNPTNGWPGNAAPVSSYDDQGRVTYTWESTTADITMGYTFGGAFPDKYVPASSIVHTTIFDQLFAWIGSVDWGTICFWGGCIGLILLFIIGSTVSSNRRKLQYLPPKISIEGHGIKRGLTAVEVAILMEQPADKVMTMILFSVIKKNAATVVTRDPLKIDVTTPAPDGLRPYETDFLAAFNLPDVTRKVKLQEMFVALVKSVSDQMKGFSRKETLAYYQDIMTKAWAEVEAAGTPEVKGQKFDDNMDWTMLDKDFNNRTRNVFGAGPVFVPIWWGRYDPVFRSQMSRPSTPSIGAGGGGPSISMPHLPGSDFAASIVNGTSAFSAGVIGNVAAFTGAVTNTTNPVPVSTSSSGGYHGGGGGHSCACACACAGCACACAGGGR